MKDVGKAYDLVHRRRYRGGAGSRQATLLTVAEAHAIANLCGHGAPRDGDLIFGYRIVCIPEYVADELDKLDEKKYAELTKQARNIFEALPADLQRALRKVIADE